MSSNTAPLPPKPVLYDHHIEGHFGKFGSGSNIQAFYLQSAVTPMQLKYIHLLGEIPGAERWPIRDLFQREVNQHRVDNEIKPHFENETDVKFFSAITLTLLPLGPDGLVASENPRAEERVEDFSDSPWQVLSREDLYRFRYPKDQPQFATLEWNSQKAMLVCIDGQHRVTTLRRIYDEATHRKVPDFEQWRIPVIVTSFKAADEDVNVPRVLEVVRQLFTNINTEAQTVSRSRLILLRDNLPNAVLTQELIQRSHKNDLKSIDRRVASDMPLICFKWRGGSTDDDTAVEPINSPDGLKSVIELHELISIHILGEDFKEKQKSWFEIMIGDEEELFDQINWHDILPISRADDFRKIANSDFVPGLAHLFENFTPYKLFIDGIRDFEVTKLQSKSASLFQHSYDELRYGLNESLTISHSKIEAAIDQIKENFVELKRLHLPRLIERAIGFRGIACAYGELADYYWDCVSPFSWREYSEAFTSVLNRVYEKGLFDEEIEHYKGVNFLEHIAVSHEGAIINFNHRDVKTALGSYLALLVSAFGLKSEFNFLCDYPDFFEEKLNYLERSFLKGFKTQAKPIVIDSHPDWPSKKITEEVNRRAAEATLKRKDHFTSWLIDIDTSFAEILGKN